MNFDGELRFLFKVDTTEAFTEALSAKLSKSVVPGFSNGRGVLALYGSKAVPKRNNLYFDVDMIPCFRREQAKYFPKLCKLVDQIFKQADAHELGMVTLAVMEPGAVIKPHRDLGPYYHHYRRLHVALADFPGAVLHSGTTEINVGKGEVWELNNVITHSARNISTIDRYHLVIDLI